MGLFRRDRYFIVLGALKSEWGEVSTPATVTLWARNHDDAEAQAKAHLHQGNGYWSTRWLEVEKVVERRP
jgi:hypothetical protein